MAIKLQGTNSAAAPGLTNDGADGIVVGTDSVDISIAGTSKVKVDSSGRFLKGVTSSEASRSNTSTRNPHVQLSSAWSSGLGSTSITCTDDYPILFLNSNATFQDNAGAGVITWSVKDSAGNYCNTAEIRSQIDGTPGNNDSPGELSFRTTADGSCQPTQRMKIHSTGNVEIDDGNLIIGTSGHGIDFSATGDSSGTTTSEILDEYEEGTWTGTIKYWDSSSGWTNAGFDTSPNNTTGLYTRIGRVVHVELYINGFDVNSTATGSYTAIAGLPFADATSDNHYGVISFAHDSCFATAAGGAYVESSMIRPTNVGTTTSSTWKSGGPLYVMLSGTYEIN